MRASGYCHAPEQLVVRVRTQLSRGAAGCAREQGLASYMEKPSSESGRGPPHYQI